MYFGDKMEKSLMIKLAAVIAVVVVVAAGAAVVLTSDSGKDSGKDPDSPSISTSGGLKIRGNVDGNNTIDQADMDLLLKVKEDPSLLSEYPYADVNGNKVVDDEDVAILQDMIDRKEGITVYVESLDRSGNTVTVPVGYPLRNVVPVGVNIQMPLLYAGGGEYIAGYFDKGYTEAEKAFSSDARNLYGSSRTISDGAWANFTKLAADLQKDGGVGAFIIDYSTISNITDQRAADLSDSGIPMISYMSADSTIELYTILTFSYLFGKDTEKIGSDYSALMDNVLKQIDGKLGSLADEDKTTYICFTMTLYICGSESTYNWNASTVHGRPYGEVNSDFASKYVSGSTVMESTEALSNYTDVGCLISNRSSDWQTDTRFGTTEENIRDLVVSTWETRNAPDFFKGLEDKLVYVNNILPGVAKLAYLAVALYGDQFTLEWANGVLQDCIDLGLVPLQGYTIEQMVPYIDYGLYLKCKN